MLEWSVDRALRIWFGGTASAAAVVGMGVPLGGWTPLQLGIGAAATVPVGMAADALFRRRDAKRRRVAAAARQAEASGKLVELEAMRAAATAARANVVIAVGTVIVAATALAPFLGKVFR